MQSAKHNANIRIVRVQKLGALIFVLLQTCLSVCPESAFLFIYLFIVIIIILAGPVL